MIRRQPGLPVAIPLSAPRKERENREVNRRVNLPTTVTFVDEAPEWVETELAPGKVFRRAGSRRMCQRLSGPEDHYVVVEIHNSQIEKSDG